MQIMVIDHLSTELLFDTASAKHLPKKQRNKDDDALNKATDSNLKNLHQALDEAMQSTDKQNDHQHNGRGPRLRLGKGKILVDASITPPSITHPNFQPSGHFLL